MQSQPKYVLAESDLSRNTQFVTNGIKTKFMTRNTQFFFELGITSADAHATKNNVLENQEKTYFFNNIMKSPQINANHIIFMHMMHEKSQDQNYLT